jgi:hypothetical protein
VPTIEDVNLQEEEPILPAGKKRVVGLQVVARPGVDTEELTITKPEKLPRLAKLREIVPEEPAAKTMED